MKQATKPKLTMAKATSEDTAVEERDAKEALFFATRDPLFDPEQGKWFAPGFAVPARRTHRVVEWLACGALEAWRDSR